MRKNVAHWVKRNVSVTSVMKFYKKGSNTRSFLSVFQNLRVVPVEFRHKWINSRQPEAISYYWPIWPPFFSAFGSNHTLFCRHYPNHAVFCQHFILFQIFQVILETEWMNLNRGKIPTICIVSEINGAFDLHFPSLLDWTKLFSFGISKSVNIKINVQGLCSPRFHLQIAVNSCQCFFFFFQISCLLSPSSVMQ